MLRQDARNPCGHPHPESETKNNSLPEEKLGGFEGKTQSAINPLDLITSVFIAANPFLQQEMFVHMSQCKFAVPLVLPRIHPEEPSQFLLWPSRSVVGQWRSHSLETNLRLSNGLIAIGWYLPNGEVRDIYPVPLALSNLRGDVSAHEKHLKLLCQISSAEVKTAQWDLLLRKANNYWRYVLVRFNERFADKVKQKPARIPEEWRMITQEEVIMSLNKVFPNKDGC
nr:PREDICTED: up-regulator of cell proliferation-like [Austrofundulus limnaeus]